MAQCTGSGFNSKCFLIRYLLVVGFLLFLWGTRLPLMEEDNREIPANLQEHLLSPPKLMPSLNMSLNEELTLTNFMFNDKWSFVYFTQSHCLPACSDSLIKMKRLETSFANSDIQFLAVGINGEYDTANTLAEFLNEQQLNVTVLDIDKHDIEPFARAFNFIFLRTDFSDGSYMIEQQHTIFLIDPKGRLYAQFKEETGINLINAVFLDVRQFYAKTE